MLFDPWKNPLLTSITALGSIIAALNALTISLGLSPFWYDTLTGIVLLYTFIHWSMYLIKKSKIYQSSERLHQIGCGSIPPLYLCIWQIGGIWLMILSSLLLLSIFFLVSPLQHLSKPMWTLCGTFVLSCHDQNRLIFLDSRKRSIFPNDIQPDDESGYTVFKAPAWWFYRPTYVTVKCGGKEFLPVSISKEMFLPSCMGKLLIK